MTAYLSAWHGTGTSINKTVTGLNIVMDKI